jgi:glycosyltransferase involved in cell wall biosynthesis
VIICGDFELKSDEPKSIRVCIKRKISIMADLKALLKLIAVVNQEQPDLVLSFMPKPGLLTGLAGLFGKTPSIHHFTGLVWSSRRGLARFFLKIIDSLTARLHTKCLFDGGSQLELFLNECWGVRPGKVCLIGQGSLNGIPDDQFIEYKDVKIRQESKGLSQNLTIGFIGRVNLEKGVVRLVNSFQAAILNPRLSHAQLVIAGPDDGAEGVLETRISRNPQVDWIRGVVNPFDLLERFDILCILSDREGFGSIVVEAAAKGIPCIGSNVTGLRDSVRDGETGFLINLDLMLAPNFEKRLLQLTYDKELYQRMSFAALRRSKEWFSRSYIMSLRVETYDAILISSLEQT